MKRIFGIVLFSIMFALMLTSIVTSAFAVSYTYLCIPFGKDGNGDPIFKASTNDPDFSPANGGFVRFWLWLGTTCDGGRDDESPEQPHIMLVEDSGYYVGYYTFVGYGDTVVCVKAHFQGDIKSVFSECVTVPFFSNVAMVLAGCIGIGVYIQRKRMTK